MPRGQPLDCLIVGGGPAGLTAGVYLARFHLAVVVVDEGNSRALQIPLTHNHAGFPDGISGEELLARMRSQACKFGTKMIKGRIDRIEPRGALFSAEGSEAELSARSILLTTGVTNRRPPIDDTLHTEALQLGRLRYCPVCDGYEVTGQDVAVIGSDARAAQECEFLRSFTDRVTLVLEGRHPLPHAIAAKLASIGVNVVGGPAQHFKLEGDGLSLSTAEGRRCFDTIYPALGSVIHSDLGVFLGARVTNEGCIEVDRHQRTNIPGLYAAGDVVIGLDQISHAMGEAGVAATTIRNDLASTQPMLR